jgi:5-methylthioribose kinase
VTGATTQTAEATAPYPLLDEGTVVAYLERRGLLDLVQGSGEPTAREVSDGNLNSVFLVRRDPHLPGLAVKQALPWVRVAGASWPLTPHRADAEARAYEYLSPLVPDLVPEYHGYDPPTFTLVMEDLAALEVLRAATVAGRRPGDVGARIGEFVGALAFATSDFGMGSTERKALIAASVNPELCLLTEDVLLTEPFVEHEHNRHVPAVDPLVRALRSDERVHTAVSALKHAFMTRGEALLHGDLHSGSVMVGGRDQGGRVAVIDPEFSFVGPVGFDLGLFWANALIAALRAEELRDEELAAEHAEQVGTSWASFADAVRAAWPGRVDRSFGDGYRELWLRSVWSDGLGYAAVEAVRRAAGYSHAADIETLPPSSRDRATARLLALSHTLLAERASVPDPAALTDLLATTKEEAE